MPSVTSRPVCLATQYRCDTHTTVQDHADGGRSIVRLLLPAVPSTFRAIIGYWWWLLNCDHGIELFIRCTSSIWWAVGEVFHVQAVCLRFPFVRVERAYPFRVALHTLAVCLPGHCLHFARDVSQARLGFIVRVASGVAWSVLRQWWVDV